MIKYLKLKFYRLKTIKNYLRLVKLYHILFKEKFRKNIKIPEFFDNRIHRIDIVDSTTFLNEINDFK
jgi:hypothetical protein